MGLYLLNCIGKPLGSINLFSSPQARIGEAEECIDGLNSKAATTEKLRSRYQLDLDELQNESERISNRVTIATKKLQTFDKVKISIIYVCSWIRDSNLGYTLIIHGTHRIQLPIPKVRILKFHE